MKSVYVYRALSLPSNTVADYRLTPVNTCKAEQAKWAFIVKAGDGMYHVLYSGFYIEDSCSLMYKKTSFEAAERELLSHWPKATKVIEAKIK